MRSVAGVVLVLALTAASPLAAGAAEEFPTYTGEQFQELYEYAVQSLLPGLEQLSDWPHITGDPDLDARIVAIAIERGYRLSPVATGELGFIDGVPMQPQVVPAWRDLKAAARGAGLRFVVSSAYRSLQSQRTQFLSKLSGTSDEDIFLTLRWYSVPGTSKHHGGYALDFRYADGTFGEFRRTPDYAWLAEDNFYNAKRFGFVPSYPDDVAEQGPNPEPWEFVWVGIDLIRCGIPLDRDRPHAGLGTAVAAALAGCPGDPNATSVGEVYPAWLLSQ